MAIKIPVQADFDKGNTDKQLAQFRQQLNAMGEQIAQANKVKFEPVDKTTIDDLQRVTKQFEALKRVSGDLRRRMKATGQEGSGLFDLDFEKLYPDQHSRNRQRAKAFSYSTGIDLSPQSGGPGSGSGGGGGNRRPGGGGGVVHQTVDSGLRATGPAGGVAANALGTGMSAGFGAGLMGLVGGILALGVGKVVGAAMGKIGEAEDNSVAYDRLKRTLGDVNVVFEALKASGEGVADSLSMTYSEAARLSTQFAKLGNISDDEYKTLAQEMGAGAGLARSFGLDDEAGVSALGTMRGMRATGSLEDTRRMALLIGETIGKSGAFAKSEEVMQALSEYARSQTRSNMGRANVEGFAGQYSAMVGSGIPGMDPSGASNLIGRINATLSAGGAKGEASQFFTSSVGQGMGLDVFQTQLLREGGAFATLDETFGEGSIADRYGMDGPSGDRTFMQSSLKGLRQKYGHNRGLLAKATSEHLGIGMRQAMAILSIDPNEMGEVSSYAGDLTGLNERGISTLTRAVTGTSGDRREISDELLSRTGDDALSRSERDRLNNAMNSGTEEEQKQILAELIKTRDQEMTQGKAVRESKAALDNIKTLMADKLIPLTQNIRDGILFMAGDREMSGAEVLKEIAEKESESREDRLRGAAEQDEAAAHDEFRRKYIDTMINARTPYLEEQEWWQDEQARISQGRERIDQMTPAEREEFEQQNAAFASRIGRMPGSVKGLETTELLQEIYGELQSQKESIRDRLSDDLGAESERLRSEKDQIDIDLEEQRRAQEEIRRAEEGRAERIRNVRDDRIGENYAPNSELIQGQGALRNPELRNYVRDKEREIGVPDGFLWSQLGVESDYNPNAVSPAGARGIAQIMPGTERSLEERFGRQMNPFDPFDGVDMQAEVMRENLERFGNLGDASRAYNGGWNRRNWNNSETRSYFPKIMDRMDQGTEMPEGMQQSSAAEQQRFVLDAMPLEIIHRNDRGQTIQASDYVSFSVSPANPFGKGGSNG